MSEIDDAIRVIQRMNREISALTAENEELRAIIEACDCGAAEALTHPAQPEQQTKGSGGK